MLDGIKIYFQISDFMAWKKAVGINLYTATDLETGQIRGKTRTINNAIQQTVCYKGKFQTYQLTIKETTKSQVNGTKSTSYFLIIDGSLHKNYYDGSNYQPFTWNYLQIEILKLETALGLSKFAEIKNLEIGVNIVLPFPAFTFLKSNLISYKGNQFNKYNPDKTGTSLGYVCPLSQYSVKVYDKGLQFSIAENLMRFELRYLKMQALKETGIKKISDLLDYNKVNGLMTLLLMAWDNTLLYDNTIDLKNTKIKKWDLELLKDGRRPGYWEHLKESNIRRYNYQRVKFRVLVEKFGQGWHKKIAEMIKVEWTKLLKNCTNLPSVQLPEMYNLTVKVNGKNGQMDRLKKEGLRVLWLRVNRSIHVDQGLNQGNFILGGLH